MDQKVAIKLHMLSSWSSKTKTKNWLTNLCVILVIRVCPVVDLFLKSVFVWRLHYLNGSNRRVDLFHYFSLRSTWLLTLDSYWNRRLLQYLTYWTCKWSSTPYVFKQLLHVSLVSSPLWSHCLLSDLSVHPEQVLPFSWGSVGNAIWLGDWHVVSGMHPGGDAHRRTSLQWIQWGKITTY